jgi:hypothetical protein
MAVHCARLADASCSLAARSALSSTKMGSHWARLADSSRSLVFRLERNSDITAAYPALHDIFACQRARYSWDVSSATTVTHSALQVLCAYVSTKRELSVEIELSFTYGWVQAPVGAGMLTRVIPGRKGPGNNDARPRYDTLRGLGSSASIARTFQAKLFIL